MTIKMTGQLTLPWRHELICTDMHGTIDGGANVQIHTLSQSVYTHVT